MHYTKDIKKNKGDISFTIKINAEVPVGCLVCLNHNDSDSLTVRVEKSPVAYFTDEKKKKLNYVIILQVESYLNIFTFTTTLLQFNVYNTIQYNTMCECNNRLLVQRVW